ncbi:MAG TPA: hypothetical protein VM912_13220 [Terriglobales bacterium]|nr:hypothetical protein [Terriglobales bacterium]
MDVFQKLHEENAKHDPHGFKSQGANSAKHAHVNAPYKFEKFPQHVYKGKHTKAVHDEAQLESALANGWSQHIPEPEQEPVKE